MEKKILKERLIKKMLCDFFGYHSWQWTLKKEGNVCEPITGEIPDRAICKRCGAVFGIDLGTPTQL